MKRFNLIRNEQIVASGVIFDCGKCAVCWGGPYCSVVIWDNFEQLKMINGQGNSLFEFLD